MNLPSQPAFSAYAITCVVLSLNLMLLWMYSGLVRGKTQTALNEEDAARFGGTLVPADPPAVARVLRVHANAQACILPFLLLGLVFVLAGGSATLGAVLFATFTTARLLHTFVYLRGLQPWRTIFFLAGMVALVALMISIVQLLLR